MKILNLLLMAVVASPLSSYAYHQFMRGSVAMKATGREAHVCLGDDEVKVGDHVKHALRRRNHGPHTRTFVSRFCQTISFLREPV
jgi:hypothetical protein